MTRLRWVLLLFSAGIALAVIGVSSQFKNLEALFSQEKKLAPIRYYSDVARIEAPMTHSRIFKKLHDLGYKTEKISNQDTSDEFPRYKFKLPAITYPDFLLAHDDPTRDIQNQFVELQFDSQGPQARLVSISVNSVEKSWLSLEPELIATMGTQDTDSSPEIRQYLEFFDIPAAIWQAVIAVEDKDFLQHRGVDPRGLARAAWINLKTFSFSQGGSTITQQLVKNLLDRKGKNVFRKLNEILLTFLVELKYPKEKILERYLNEVDLGQIGPFEIHGIGEASQHYFNKRVVEVSLSEAALLAGMIRGAPYYSPYRFPDRAKQRRDAVLKKMRDAAFISETELKIALGEEMKLAPQKVVLNKAPYFVDFVNSTLPSLDSLAGVKVYTSLDMNLNAKSQEIIAVNAPIDFEGAMMAIEARTGLVRAVVGGKSFAESNFNRALNTRRQVGSIIKPFIFALALRELRDQEGVALHSGYPVLDEPWTRIYGENKKTWSPRNFRNQYRGLLTLSEALAYSSNVVVGKLAAKLGEERIVEYLNALGIKGQIPSLPSLSLGAVEFTLLEMSRMYSIFLNDGLNVSPIFIRSVVNESGESIYKSTPQSEAAMSEDVAQSVREMLRQVLKIGTGKSTAEANQWQWDGAGKTGTTSDFRDAWFAGFTPSLCAVVWYGKDKSITEGNLAQTKRQITGGQAPLKAWIDIMKTEIDEWGPKFFNPSQSLQEIEVDGLNGRAWNPDCETRNKKVAFVSKRLDLPVSQCGPYKKDMLVESF